MIKTITRQSEFCEDSCLTEPLKSKDKVTKSRHSGTRHLILLTFFQARLGDDICGVEDIGEEEEGQGVPQPLDMSSKCHHVRSRRIITGFLIRTHKIDSENSSERSDISDTQTWL